VRGSRLIGNLEENHRAPSCTAARTFKRSIGKTAALPA
jgi:hypothetical protein